MPRRRRRASDTASISFSDIIYMYARVPLVPARVGGCVAFLDLASKAATTRISTDHIAVGLASNAAATCTSTGHNAALLSQSR